MRRPPSKRRHTAVSAVARHADRHLEGNLSRALATAQDVLDSISTTAIVGRALDLATRADSLLNRAEAGLSLAAGGDLDPKRITAAAAAMREARSTVELLAKLAIAAGDIDGAGSRVEDQDLDRKLEAYLDAQLHPEDEVLEAEVVEDEVQPPDRQAERAAARLAGTEYPQYRDR